MRIGGSNGRASGDLLSLHSSRRLPSGNELSDAQKDAKDWDGSEHGATKEHNGKLYNRATHLVRRVPETARALHSGSPRQVSVVYSEEAREHRRSVIKTDLVRQLLECGIRHCPRTITMSSLQHPYAVAEKPMRSLIGSLVAGRFQIEDILGSGGMATVYQAVHRRNGHRVALKVLNEGLARNEEVRERFFREAFTANQVEHPGVVTAWDDGELEDGTPFLVLELLEGQNFNDRWQDKGLHLPWEEVCDVASLLLSILEVAHDKKIIHRDIKPENLFLTSKGELKLLDFGIARTDAAPSRLTRQRHTAMGTPCFMPPEQARGHWDEVDERADLFAVAATMFTLMSGRFVHEGATDSEVLLSAMTRPASPLLAVMPGAPISLARFIDRGLSFSADLRFESARAMRRALEEIRSNLGASLPLESVHCSGVALETELRAAPDSLLRAEPVTHHESSRHQRDTLPSAAPAGHVLPPSRKVRPRRHGGWTAVAMVTSSLVGASLVHAQGFGHFVKSSFARDPEMTALVQTDPWQPPDEIWGSAADAAEPPAGGPLSGQREHPLHRNDQEPKGSLADDPDKSVPPIETVGVASKLRTISHLVSATDLELPELSAIEIHQIGHPARAPFSGAVGKPVRSLLEAVLPALARTHGGPPNVAPADSASTSPKTAKIDQQPLSQSQPKPQPLFEPRSHSTNEAQTPPAQPASRSPSEPQLLSEPPFFE